MPGRPNLLVIRTFPIPSEARAPGPALSSKRMARKPDSGRLALADVFLRVQQEMLAQLAVGGLFEHASAAGAASEHHWVELFNRFLPQRYRSAPAFVLDHAGRRSRQIDIAIFDNLYSPLLFPHGAGIHIPAESVYAVFEVKPTFSCQWLRDAAVKAASVRSLARTSVPVIAHGKPRSRIAPRPILAGLLATTSVWNPETFAENLIPALHDYSLDLGCSLQHGSFELTRTPRRKLPRIRVSDPSESLIFFMLRLLDRLRAMGTAPAADLTRYARGLKSLRPTRPVRHISGLGVPKSPLDDPLHGSNY